MNKLRPYPFRAKILPFVKGIAGLVDDTSGPLVEVAMEALLNRDLNPQERARYLAKVGISGTTEQIYTLLMRGCPQDEQEGLVKAFGSRYSQELAKFDRKVGIALGETVSNPENPRDGEIVNPRRVEYFGEIALELESRKSRHQDITARHAFEILYMGKLTSNEAQKSMAIMILSEGTKEQAQELLERGSLTSSYAKNMLVFKCRERPEDRVAN